MMLKPYTKVSLGKFLVEINEFIEINDLVRYKRARNQWYGKGIILRDEINGNEVKTKRQQIIRAGEFLVAEIDAKEGSFGVVPEELDGAIVSSHYFVFQIDVNICIRSWLDLVCRANFFQNQVVAQGSTNYSAVRPSQILALEIPLPTLEEQHRIVARIETLSVRSREALFLQNQIEKEIDALIDSFIGKLINENKYRWAFGVIPEFAEVNPSRKGQINLKPDDLVSFVPMSAVDNVTGTIARPQPRLFHEVSKGHTWFIDGDVIFARITPCMENGKSAIARDLINCVGFGSTEFHVIRP
jgi:hypothetical protein